MYIFLLWILITQWLLLCVSIVGNKSQDVIMRSTLGGAVHLPMECVFQCGEYIARKMMKQHCQQQCDNARRILSQQQDDKFVITCIAVQQSEENWDWLAGLLQHLKYYITVDKLDAVGVAVNMLFNLVCVIIIKMLMLIQY